MNFLFWNIKKNTTDRFLECVVQLLIENEIDVLMIAELPEENISAFEQYIQMHTQNKYRLINGFVFKKVVIFATDKTEIGSFDETGKRIGAFKIKSSVLEKDILLFPIHYYDKKNTKEDEQDERIRKIRNFIETVENRNGEKNLSIICGDFNLNHFQKPIKTATGMHAMMDKNIAQKGKRIVDGDEYTYFYNPMWGFFGDMGKGEVSGSYYYPNSGNHIVMFWHIFDQLLLRKGLISYLNADKLNIVTRINGHCFLKEDGSINANVFSDHLPITFSLNI